MKEKMFELAREAVTKAYAPYSRLQVVACVKADNDELFSGCNMENAVYGLTECAETGALMAMVRAGRKKIKEAVVTSSSEIVCPPCGACRQRLAELADGDIKIHLLHKNGQHKTFNLSELLPHPFGSINLEDAV